TSSSRSLVSACVGTASSSGRGCASAAAGASSPEGMREPAPLGLQIGAVLGGRPSEERDPLDDRQPVALEPRSLRRVVREQAQLAQAELAENLHADPVVAAVSGIAETMVGLNRVESPVLERVGVKLGEQPDAAALVAAEVDDGPAPGVSDLRQGKAQLCPAVTATGAEHIPGEALGMNADERRV